jgi:hypothetical protein
MEARMSRSEENERLAKDVISCDLIPKWVCRFQDLVEHIQFWATMNCDRKYPLSHNTSMIRADSQFLADIAPFPEVHFGSESQRRNTCMKEEYEHPPMTSRLDSIGNACKGVTSVVPSGTP